MKIEKLHHASLDYSKGATTSLLAQSESNHYDVIEKVNEIIDFCNSLGEKEEGVLPISEKEKNLIAWLDKEEVKPSWEERFDEKFLDVTTFPYLGGEASKLVKDFIRKLLSEGK